MSTSTSAFMMWPNIHIFVTKCFQITAHTCTFTACFATGLYCCSLLIFTLTVLVYLTSCTELSLHHMISSCPLLQCISSHTPFSSPCSEIIGPVFILTTTQWSFWCRNRWRVCTDIVLSNFLVIKQCNLVALSSSTSCSILSIYNVMVFVITDGRPDLLLSANPAPYVQQ